MGPGIYAEDDGAGAEGRRRDGGSVAGQVFLWLAWALGAGITGLALTASVGILRSGAPTSVPAAARGDIDAGGFSWLIIEVAAVVVLGLAMAWGLFRWSGRSRQTDAIAAQATRAQYDGPRGDTDRTTLRDMR